MNPGSQEHVLLQGARRGLSNAPRESPPYRYTKQSEAKPKEAACFPKGRSSRLAFLSYPWTSELPFLSYPWTSEQWGYCRNRDSMAPRSAGHLARSPGAGCPEIKGVVGAAGPATSRLRLPQRPCALRECSLFIHLNSKVRQRESSPWCRSNYM